MSIMEWAKRMETLLGPDDCKGFLIRSLEPHLQGLWLSEGRWLFVPTLHQAQLFSWAEAAVKCTVNRKLEAVRVDRGGMARDSKGNVVGLT